MAGAAVRKPLLLDAFCGAGGCSWGYVQAGFRVVGVDIVEQPNYPFDFIKADALEYIACYGQDYAFTHASPPCQAFTRAGKLREAQGGTAHSTNLLPATRAVLRLSGKPYLIENVEGAPLREPVLLCGSSFGLRVRRHRLFESPLALTGLPCQHKAQGRPVGVYHRMRDSIPHGGRTAHTLEEAQHAMGIDWMQWKELTQAIPPAYTRYIGQQLLEVL